MPRLHHWLSAVALGASALVPSTLASQAVRPIAASRFVLPNGMVVLLNEDHSSPIVALEMLYHFGAKDERPNQGGFAHMCEHLMGTGSTNVPQEEKQLIQAIGGLSNSGGASWAATDEDRTHYFYTVPSNQLETVLWLESDRMAFPFSRVTPENFKINRDIVRQERRQRVDDVVFGDADRLVLDAFFAAQPHHVRSPLPPMNDLDGATPDSVVAACKPYYVPNNAILALSGDFKSASVRTLVTRYFGGIARGKPVTHAVASPSPSSGERRQVMEDARAKAPTLRLMWFTAGFSEADRLPLNLLASLLAPADPRQRQLLPGADRAARLSRALVVDRPLATSVSVGNIDMEKGAVFQIVVTPRGDASLSAIEAVVDSVLTDLKTSPPTEAELTPFKKFTEVLGTTSLQTRAARADTLAQGEAFAKDPIAYAKQADRTLRITPADVQAVAKKYLTTNRIVLSLVPAGRIELASKPNLPYVNITPGKSVNVP